MPIAHRVLLAALVVLLAICSGGALQADAQETAVTLTILVPDWARDILNEAVFDEFEAQHPGVRVVLAQSPDVPGIPPAADDLDFHLDMAYRECTAAIPPYDPAAGEDRSGYVGQVLSCAVRIDPVLRSRFGAG